jgi:hypothetical protein
VWQPGKVTLDKITTNHAYLAATNYWTPLQSNDSEEDEKEEEEANITYKIPIKEIPKPNKWERRLARRIEKRMIIDSGATSHFCSEEMDLPKEGESNKAVDLPNGDTIQTTKRTSLPFRLSKRAREAHVLPHLQQSLMSVNKLAEEGNTTIFHPENKGVTIHERGTLSIATSSPPVLQGCKENNLWTVSANEEEREEEANNVYTLPSTKQSVRYLHAAAGIPVESEWIKAIKAGNYVTWLELTTEAVHKHFPESDELQKGHMKQQRQNVGSTKVKQNATDVGQDDDDDCDDQIKPQAKLNREIYITGTALCSTGTGYSTSTVRLSSWYCPTSFCQSIVFHFSVGLRYVRLMSCIADTMLLLFC